MNSLSYSNALEVNSKHLRTRCVTGQGSDPSLTQARDSMSKCENQLCHVPRQQVLRPGPSRGHGGKTGGGPERLADGSGTRRPVWWEHNGEERLWHLAEPGQSHISIRIP